jgi:peptidase E
MGFLQIKLPKRIKHKIENSKRNREALAKYKIWLESKGLDDKTLKKSLKEWKGYDIPKYEPDPNYPKCSDKIPVGTSKKKEVQQYSGERKLLGIATMHKSNMVPVFDKEDAKDIAKMRR